MVAHSCATGRRDGFPVLIQPADGHADQIDANEITSANPELLAVGGVGDASPFVPDGYIDASIYLAGSIYPAGRSNDPFQPRLVGSAQAYLGPAVGLGANR